VAKPKLHPIYRWIRATGIGSEAFGWGSLMLAGQFVIGAALIYLGFLLLAIDLWVEPDLRGKTVWRVVFTGFIVLLAAAFSWGMVFVDDALDVSGLVTDAEYAQGTKISGVAWRPEFTELNVMMVNPTDRVYEDLNLVIRPTEPVIAIEQISDFPGVSFVDKNDFMARMLDISPSGSSKAIPLDLLATDAGYRVRCPRLPAHSTLKILIALGNLRWDPRPHFNTPVEEQARDSDYVLKVKFDDFSTYWEGHREGAVYTPRPSIEWFKVEGDFVVTMQKRKIDKKIYVNGNITVRRK
jgi:hypothetical protein